VRTGAYTCVRVRIGAYMRIRKRVRIRVLLYTRIRTRKHAYIRIRVAYTHLRIRVYARIWRDWDEIFGMRFCGDFAPRLTLSLLIC
jgi:hypothetical protein